MHGIRFVPAPAPFTNLPRRYFRVIYMDPPWDYSSGKGRRHPSRHYPVMPLKEIAALPVRDLAHPEGARLLFWTTGPFLMKSFEIVRGYGFRYSTTRVWGKLKEGVEEITSERDLNFGTGLEVIDNAEFLIVAKVGQPRRAMGTKPMRLFFGALREHSRKPDKVRDEIERKYRGPHCELFAQSERPLWWCWGNMTSRYQDGA